MKLDILPCVAMVVPPLFMEAVCSFHGFGPQVLRDVAGQIFDAEIHTRLAHDFLPLSVFCFTAGSAAS